jgi:hypothetical protein
MPEKISYLPLLNPQVKADLHETFLQIVESFDD